jgi:two-component system response regulator HydG
MSHVASITAQRDFHEQFSRLLEELGIGVFTVDKERRITSFNQTVERLTGFKEEEVLGKQCYEVLLSDLCQGECAFHRVVQATGTSLSVDMEIRDQNGNVRRITKIVSPLVNAQGEVSGCVEIFQDHSAYRDLLERIGYDEDQLKLILDNLDLGVFTVNRSGHITSFNSMAETVTGYRRQEIVGQHHEKLMTCHRQGASCLLAESIKTGMTLANRTIQLVGKDGRELPIRASCMALRNESGQIIGGLATFQDLSVIQHLDRAISDKYTFADMIGKDGSMQQIFEILPVVAASDANVLIEGSTGTGKDLLAKIIHNSSPRKKRAFVKVNCAAMPDNLLESEMFGYVKGAFTGAHRDKPGRFQEADGGTIFLDEIGDLPLSLQAKLLRVLEDKEFYPLGSQKLHRVDVRIIAATNQGLKNLVQQKLFREDLYYRLNVMRLELPPLKRRRGDIPLLIRRFLKQYTAARGTGILKISQEALDVLLNYPYPGNIRELENIIEHACILCQGEAIERRHLPVYIQTKASRQDDIPSAPGTVLEGQQEWERHRLLQALEECHWNRRQAAKALGIDRTTLWRKLKKHRLTS